MNCQILNTKITINILNKYNYCKKVFLPFRLTDMGYKTQEIVDYLLGKIKEYGDTKVLKIFDEKCDVKLWQDIK